MTIIVHLRTQIILAASRYASSSGLQSVFSFHPLAMSQFPARSIVRATVIPAPRTRRYPRRRPPDRPISSRWCRTAAAIPSYRPSSSVLSSNGDDYVRRDPPRIGPPDDYADEVSYRCRYRRLYRLASRTRVRPNLPLR